MKCKSVIVYYSKANKPIAYTPVIAGCEPKFAPPLDGLRIAKTSFARAYVRFPRFRLQWNPDGTQKTAAIRSKAGRSAGGAVNKSLLVN
jgi:hypothetical protein